MTNHMTSYSAFHEARRSYSSNGSSAADYYVTLGVPPYASAEEIKGAYKKLALQYHPDRNSDPGAEETFKNISAAYHVIGNKQRRQQYDMERRVSQDGGHHSQWGGPPGSSAEGGGDFTYQRMTKEDADQLFREMFGGIRVEDLIRDMEKNMGQWGSGGASRGMPTGRLFGNSIFSSASSSNRSSSRVFFDRDGNRMEEHTFSGPQGTYYRVSQQSSSNENVGQNQQQSSHPFFDSYYRQQQAQQQPSGSNRSHGSNDWQSSRDDPAAEWTQVQRPTGAMTVRLIMWITLVTIFIWLIISTMIAHPLLMFTFILLMMAGRRRHF